MNHSSGLNSDVSAENSANSLFPEELTSKSSNELRQTRINFIQDLRAQGINPYIGKFERDFTCYQASKTPIGQDVSVAGRVVLFRSFGKLVFGTLQDQSGRIQFSLKADTLGKDEVKRLSQLISNGDHVGIFGDIWETQKGEITVNAKRFELLSKSLMPLPTKYEGIKDVETLQRNRPLDLISNLETRERFLARSKMISNLRHFMEEKGFIEVETPILQGAACGASAQPFTTHHNALDTDFYLRISPETYLKRVIAGGLEKVFEIGKNFRNEGTDASHLQEFTMLEWYVA
nr:lysine--tRNA ligase [Pseudomonadota bacterium]